MKTKLILDVRKTQYAQLNSMVMGRVGDKESNTVDVYVVDGFVPYNLTGSDVYFECAKPDNTSVRDKNGIVMIDAAKGHFEYTFPAQTFAAVGKSKQAYFSIEKNSTVKATTQDFIIVSIPDALTNRIPSQTYISQLDQLIKDLEAMQLDVLNSVAYQEAHDAKIFAEQAKLISESVKAQLDQIVIQGSIDPETKQARVDGNGFAYPLLKDRIDAEQKKIEKINKRVTQINLDEYENLKSGNDWKPAFIQAINDLPIKGKLTFTPNKSYSTSQVDIVKEIQIEGDTTTIMPINDSGYIFNIRNTKTKISNLLIDMKGFTNVVGIRGYNVADSKFLNIKGYEGKRLFEFDHSYVNILENITGYNHVDCGCYINGDYGAEYWFRNVYFGAHVGKSMNAGFIIERLTTTNDIGGFYFNDSFVVGAIGSNITNGYKLISSTTGKAAITTVMTAGGADLIAGDAVYTDNVAHLRVTGGWYAGGFGKTDLSQKNSFNIVNSDLIHINSAYTPFGFRLEGNIDGLYVHDSLVSFGNAFKVADTSLNLSKFDQSGNLVSSLTNDATTLFKGITHKFNTNPTKVYTDTAVANNTFEFQYIKDAANKKFLGVNSLNEFVIKDSAFSSDLIRLTDTGTIFTKGNVRPNNSNSGLFGGLGSPEGVVSANRGSVYMRSDNTGGINSVYLKTSNDGTNTGWKPVGTQIPFQADSTSTDITALRTDFNNLLAKLRTSGIMANS